VRLAVVHLCISLTHAVQLMHCNTGNLHAGGIFVTVKSIKGTRGHTLNLAKRRCVRGTRKYFTHRVIVSF